MSWKTNAVSGKQAVLFWDNGNFQFETAGKTEEISICGCSFFSSLKSGFQSALTLCVHHFQISSFKKSPFENTLLKKPFITKNITIINCYICMLVAIGDEGDISLHNNR